MKKFINTRTLFWIALGLIILDYFCFNGILELRNEEPRRALVSLEMMESGDYLIPHIHGETYYNKPPLYNWILAGSFKIFGAGEWSVRLPGVLSLIVTAFFFWRITSKSLNEETRLLLPFIFLSSADILFFGSVNAGEIDLFYSLIICLQVYTIFHFYEKQQYLKLFLVSYFLCALGVLTKGIPSLAFQAITLLAYFIAQKNFLKLISWQHITGIALLFSMVGGYLYYYSLSEDVWAFLSQQFKEASQRTGNESTFVDLIIHLVRFPLTLIEKMFPWSLLLLPLVFRRFRKMVWEDSFGRFTIIFILSNILIYWFSPDMRIRYVYMFFPFILFLGVKVYNEESWSTKLMLVPKYIMAFGVGAIGVGMIALPFILQVESIPLMITSFLIGVILIVICLLSYSFLSSIKFLWLLVIALLMGRLGYNAVVIPEMERLNEDLKYERIVSEMLDITSGQAVTYTGPMETLEPNVSLFGKELYSRQLHIPIAIPFQIPYYYAFETGEILDYEAEVNDPSAYYLMYERDLWFYPVKKDILYSFEANTNHLQLVLFKINTQN